MTAKNYTEIDIKVSWACPILLDFFSLSLRKKCAYSELLWSVFSRNRTKYGEILSVQMRENTGQNNSEYGHLSRSLSH